MWFALYLVSQPGVFEPVVPFSVAPPSWYGGRVLTTESVHLGIRPAGIIDNEGGTDWGIAVTLQVTVRVPW